MLEWDEAKRKSNLAKHGFDFRNAALVLDSRYRMDIEVTRSSELRVQSFSYVMDRLAVLTVVHAERGELLRIISFRAASQRESETYYEWLDQKED